MLINKLEVQRFRGIRDNIQLDLTAPLTIIYAANGTGKTSICDAVEWTLSGSVRRLQNPDSADDIRCVFGEKNTFTAVEMEEYFDFRSRSTVIRRELLDTGESFLLKDDITIKNAALLNSYVPNIPASKRDYQADWLYSTTFLDSDSLRLLIDDDKEGTGARRLIFSNLFGIQHYQELEKKLLSIFKAFDSAKKTQKEKDRIQGKISEIKEAIEKLSKLEQAPHYEAALSLLLKIGKDLSYRISDHEVDSPSAIYQQLEMEIITFAEKTNRRNEALNDIKNERIRIHEIIAEYTSYNSQSLARASANNLLKIQKEENERNYKLQLEEKDNLTRRKLTLNSAKIALQENYNLYKQYRLDFDSYNLSISPERPKLAALIDHLNILASRLSAAKTKEHNIKTVLLEVQEWLSLENAIKSIDIEVSATKDTIEKTNPDQTQEQLAHVTNKLQELHQIRQDELDELNVILTSGKKYLEVNPDIAKCPLCDSDYEDPALLLQRVNLKFLSLSENTQVEARLIADQKILNQKIDQAKALQEKIKLLQSKKEFTSSQILIAEAKIKEIGFVMDNPLQNPTLISEIQNVGEINKIALSQAQLEFDNCNKATKAGANILEIKTQLEKIARSVFADTSLTLQNVSEASDLSPNFSFLELEINKFLEKVTKDEITLHKLIEDKISFMQELAQKMESANSETTVISHGVVTRKNLLNSFKEKWEIANGLISDNKSDTNLLISDEDIDKASRSIESRNSLHKEMLAHLAKAKEHIDSGRLTEKNKSEKEVFNRQINALNDELHEQNNIDKYRISIEIELEKVRAEIKTFVSEQMQPLTNIISALYLRAQGNKFINSIDAKTNKQGVLDWIAKLNDGGDQLENMHELSQGQRQDLALAIFLARARSLGGTFFLDEPFAHLDDLNKVALLDTLRVIVSEARSEKPLRIVMTTASNNLVRHLKEKFSLLEIEDNKPAMRLYTLNGNPKMGITCVPEAVQYKTQTIKSMSV